MDIKNKSGVVLFAVPGANLSDANLENANLSGADLSDASLSGAKLDGANLENADLRNASLENANLRTANLIGANLENADLSDANLSGTDLSGADLRTARLDHSCWPLWRGSKNVAVDRKLVLQLLAHICAIKCDDPEVIATQKQLLPLALQSHVASHLRSDEKEDA